MPGQGPSTNSTIPYGSANMPESSIAGADGRPINPAFNQSTNPQYNPYMPGITPGQPASGGGGYDWRKMLASMTQGAQQGMMGKQQQIQNNQQQQDIDYQRLMRGMFKIFGLAPKGTSNQGGSQN